ncbi:hypothetical protein LFYK43_08050 [Ligilactobacillus salitolerans]|uniref:DUF1934 domain-containing protein n=1 Tax=Ligilactobacillus salitolerans TaxID=1808352 RepID=A0A401IS55_9LACO|nr:DUF1934 domain-containing protein [Ligilactobacillus salitolerans]GBG94346.1 hypothetical protein LFYK43_08050 [Ligilactobacillus salitolerans]
MSEEFSKGLIKTARTEKSEVMIHLETQSIQDGETQNLVQDVPGQFFNIGKTFYLRYQENLEDNEAATVTFKFSGEGEVQLTRQQGENRSRMFFVVDHQLEAHYQTPYGDLPLTTVTPRMNITLGDYPVRGKISIDYGLFSQGQELGEYKIRLQFTA